VQDLPNSRQLLEAVAQFLESELIPALGDPRLRFRALVAANVLHIVARELEMGDTRLTAELERLGELLAPVSGTGSGADARELNLILARLIRAGDADEGPFHDAVLAHVRQTVIEKLEIANPRYLERFKQTES
jgi:hypothetical protein